MLVAPSGRSVASWCRRGPVGGRDALNGSGGDEQRGPSCRPCGHTVVRMDLGSNVDNATIRIVWVHDLYRSALPIRVLTFQVAVVDEPVIDPEELAEELKYARGLTGRE